MAEADRAQVARYLRRLRRVSRTMYANARAIKDDVWAKREAQSVKACSTMLQVLGKREVSSQ